MEACLLSSQIMESTDLKISRALKVLSPKLPMGVATMYNMRELYTFYTPLPRLYFIYSITIGKSEITIIPITAYSKLSFIKLKPPKKYPRKVKLVTQIKAPMILNERKVE